MIPFNKPHIGGKELWYIAQAHANNQLAGDGNFTKQCQEWLEKTTSSKKALLTHSCTAALEMSAMLANIQPGDEVIMPSYTFVSTANAFALRGGTPVFVDIRPDTLNLDELKVESAITSKTRAIVVVHYGGVACEMDTIMDIAERHNLLVIEDAAQGIMASYKGRPLGSIGHLGTLSFHETKNISSGEGGALLINNAKMIEHAEIIREKGTNRSMFFRGEVDKYTWVNLGSSYLPGEIIAAFLWAQMEEAEEITTNRLTTWAHYHTSFAELENSGVIQRPIIPNDCAHNAHQYYLLLPNLAKRSQFIHDMKSAGIHCVFHYIPLHSSPYGQKLGNSNNPLSVTENIANRIVRLPLWFGMEETQNYIIDASIQALTN